MTEQLHTSCIRAHLYFHVIGKTFAHQRDKVFPMTQKTDTTVPEFSDTIVSVKLFLLFFTDSALP